jgi:CubicO group peptidase (beta-lactamase class C family)
MHLFVLPMLLPLLGPAQVSDKELHAELESAREKHSVPALGAAIVSSKGLLAIHVVGVRKKGSDAKVTIDDRFHLGSDSKAMTATLIAVLVEKKRLAYDQTLARAFPELAETMQEDFRGVTLDQLLRHRGGLPANLPGGWGKINRKDPIRTQRDKVAAIALIEKPAAKPDTRFLYSNIGYTLAGAIAERREKSSWEELIRQHLFGPLKMSTGGFGAAGTKGKIDQPWGHHEDGKPQEPGPNSDNVPVMGPAGRIHCSLDDWAKFIADQLKGAQGKDGLLKASAYRKLHEPADAKENYTAGGWLVLKTPIGPTLGHDGSNTMNYATAMLVLKADLAVLVVCNQGGKTAVKATHQVRDGLMKTLLAKKGKKE